MGAFAGGTGGGVLLASGKRFEYSSGVKHHGVQLRLHLSCKYELSEK